MAPRARYDGPHLEVVVDDPNTDDEPVLVKRGGLLPKEIAARTRDDLLSREDWIEVKDPGSSSSSTVKKEG